MNRNIEEVLLEEIKSTLKRTSNKDKRESISTVNSQHSFEVWYQDILDLDLYADPERLNSAIEEIKELNKQLEEKETKPYLDPTNPGRSWTVDGSGVVASIKD